jgi:3-oxoacyl-[acyl-carrier protein] reductase
MSDDVILITGGSRGIGRALVEMLAADGARVAFTYHVREDAARELEERAGDRVRAYQYALSDRARPDDLVERVETELGRIAGLVNNAAIESSQLLAMTSDATWDEMLDHNLGGTFRVTRAVLRRMVSLRRGSIVNVASLSALRGVAGQAAYAASKAGLLAMTRCLAREMGRRRIRVNAVVPGFVATEMTAHLDDATVTRLRDPECLPDGTGPEAVAATIAFLLSDRAAAITGQTVVVDAGNTA